MKLSIFVFTFLWSQLIWGQEPINPYNLYQQVAPTAFTNNISSYHFQIPLNFSSLINNYTGEYEILKGLDKVWDVRWGGFAAISYKIETVSFPFTMDCAYYFPDGCADGGTDRKLYMPNNSLYPFNPINKKWEAAGALGALSLETPTPGVFTIYGSYSQTHQNLISSGFEGINILNPAYNRTYLPHTILKHTYYIHCDMDPLNDQIADSVVWFYDNTRGRMRYYPFIYPNTHTNTGPLTHDICFIPEFLYLTPSNGGQNHNYSFSQNNLILNYEAINYFPYSDIPEVTSCFFQKPTLTSDWFGDVSNIGTSPYPAPNTLFSAPARNDDGKFLAGYSYIFGGTPQVLPGIMHEYYIDRGFPDLDLKWINPHEKVIFNPSDVNVGPKPGNSNLVNLIFPAKYTFKTILGIYPSVQEAEQANTAANGGPYDYLKDVPVPVNASELMPFGANPIDYPDVSSYDDPNTSVVDERYGNYTLNDHSKITVEECVKIFDAIFYVNQGATLQFNNYPSVLNEERFKILWGGGAILKNYAAIQYAQNGVITQDYELKYIALNEIQAGNSVDPDPAATQDDYTIEPGNTDVKFEAGNTIRLEPGFSAKEGSNFSAKCHPISYPTNLCASPPNTGNRLASALGGRSKAVQALLANNSNSALRISPNPGTGIFSVQLQNIKEAFSYEVSDVYGRKVLSSKGNSTDNKIDLSEQPQGIYIVSARLDGKLWVEKIIKE